MSKLSESLAAVLAAARGVDEEAEAILEAMAFRGSDVLEAVMRGATLRLMGDGQSFPAAEANDSVRSYQVLVFDPNGDTVRTVAEADSWKRGREGDMSFFLRGRKVAWFARVDLWRVMPEEDEGVGS